MKPTRLAAAQTLCRYLPPLLSQRVRNWVYPRSLAYQDDYPFTVRATTGSFFQHTTSDYHGYNFAVHGYSFWRAWAVALAVCSPGETIVEIGANIGTETIGFSDIVGALGQVLAFEPLPSNLEALYRNFRENGINQVKVLPYAVSNVSKKAFFSLPPTRNMSGVGHIVTVEAQERQESIEVTCVPLDSFREKIGTVKLIFIDAEGSEMNILHGAQALLEESKPFLVLEASPKLLKRFGHNIQDMFLLLQDHKYKMYHVSTLGLVAVTSANMDNSTNWFCQPDTYPGVERVVDRYLKRCGLMPCIKGLNPLVF